MGANATLELTPFQAETIVLAQRVGQLSLILRSMTDAN
jgi:pilus assembly protein CpaB